MIHQGASLSSPHRDPKSASANASASANNSPAPGRAHFICWGEVIWDVFPDRRMLGGAPANVAYHLAALGERVSLASRVGDDAAGAQARAALAGHGVGVDTVQIDPTRPTGWVEVTFADAGAGAGREPRYRLVSGCAWERIEVDQPVARALGEAAAFCYGTLSQRASNVGFDQALTLLPAACLRVCDVNLRPGNIVFEVLHAALAAADVVKINEQEAVEIAGLVGVAEVADLPAWLFGELGVRLVALTRGPAGCRLISPTESVEHAGFALAHANRPPGDNGGDNVGAGDGFTAVLTKLVHAGRSLEFIAEASNRYGAYVASRRGATPDIDPQLIAAICANEAPSGSV